MQCHLYIDRLIDLFSTSFRLVSIITDAGVDNKTKVPH